MLVDAPGRRRAPRGAASAAASSPKLSRRAAWKPWLLGGGTTRRRVALPSSLLSGEIRRSAVRAVDCLKVTAGLLPPLLLTLPPLQGNTVSPGGVGVSFRGLVPPLLHLAPPPPLALRDAAAGGAGCWLAPCARGTGRKASPQVRLTWRVAIIASRLPASSSTPCLAVATDWPAPLCGGAPFPLLRLASGDSAALPAQCE